MNTVTKWTEKFWAVGYQTADGFCPVAIIHVPQPHSAISLCNYLNGGSCTAWREADKADLIEWR